jgi:hypothetical protein
MRDIVRYSDVWVRGRHIEKSDENVIPRNIKNFWKLQSRTNGNPKTSPARQISTYRGPAFQRFSLLRFYAIDEYKWWNRDSGAFEVDSSESSEENLTLEDAVRSYPSLSMEASRIDQNIPDSGTKVTHHRDEAARVHNLLEVELVLLVACYLTEKRA